MYIIIFIFVFYSYPNSKQIYYFINTAIEKIKTKFFYVFLLSLIILLPKPYKTSLQPFFIYIR